MNLQSEIKTEIWHVLKSNYENGNYSGAILDAMYFLSELIRNKTGLEGDGVALIGNAFGSTDPKIKINNLQTDSDKDAQKGMAEILRGMYTGIRNPRSHDRVDDSRKEADSIIKFIDYLVSIIEISRLSFEESAFLERVYDEHYVATKEYSDLLVEAIPVRQRKNVAIKVVMNRLQGEVKNIKFFTSSILEALEEQELSEVMKVISEELKYKQNSEEARIRTILGILKPDDWEKVDKDARLRIENILIKDAEEGLYDEEQDYCHSGHLATWANDGFVLKFSNKAAWNRILVDKLKSEDSNSVSYVKNFFKNVIIKLNTPKPAYYFETYITTELAKNNQFAMSLIKNEVEYDTSHPWNIEFKKEIEMYGIESTDLPF